MSAPSSSLAKVIPAWAIAAKSRRRASADRAPGPGPAALVSAAPALPGMRKWSASEPLGSNAGRPVFFAGAFGALTSCS